MKENLYKRLVRELRMNVENVWDMFHTRPTGDFPPVYIIIPVEMIDEITDRAVLRTLESASQLMDKYSEIPSLSRSSAAKKLGKTAKTLREWEEKGALVPVYIEGSPYYRLSDIERLNEKKGRMT